MTVVDYIRKTLKDITESVVEAITMLDAAMKMPSTAERGKKIALISNRLDFANDAAMHFGLDYGLKKIANIKKKASETISPPSAPA